MLDPEEQLFHKRGQKGSKVIEPAADTLRILADCRPFLKRLLPFEKEKEKEEERESRSWESFWQESRARG